MKSVQFSDVAIVCTALVSFAIGGLSASAALVMAVNLAALIGPKASTG